MMKLVVPFKYININDLAKHGGKVASLGEMYNKLNAKNIPVPNGFSVSADAFHYFIEHNQLHDKIQSQLCSINNKQLHQLRTASKNIQRLILNSSFPEELKKDIKSQYNKLKGLSKIGVAVRSSATCEDLPTASFAGLHDSYMYIKNFNELLNAIQKSFASLYNARAISYRLYNQLEEESIAMAVGVQVMVKSDKAVSGVMFSIDTETGFDKVVLINAVYGLGEGIVSGKISPDEYLVYKPNLTINKDAILKKKSGMMTIRFAHQNNQVIAKSLSKKQQAQFCITDSEITHLAKMATVIEKHYKKPMDIEWAKDNGSDKIYIVQARPETVKSQQSISSITHYELQDKGSLICHGVSVGSNIGCGIARIIKNPKNVTQFNQGDVLVADTTDPDWEPIMRLASAIVTNRGGRTCHAAIIARELGIPAVIGTNVATKKISNNKMITVSCAEGEIGSVYHDKLRFNVDTIEIKKMPKPPVKITMNLGNPGKAFLYQALPHHGIGLARIEFIISNMIGIHPQALIDFKKLPNSLKNKISKLTNTYDSPTEFYIEKLKEGMAMLAAAFAPHPVIFRFSDFKSNEYANLLGGERYEPKEENPMIGYRGASRYVSDFFQDCFALECEAVKRLRNNMGLKNAEVMVPFTRTVDEAKNVISVLKKFGLQRGKHGLKIHMMCEIPSNALLAEDFLKHFDGFSIGSNDLTQLTLGIDRDSVMVAPLFDERNAAVKVLLSQAIKACRKQKKYVGICGQAPSDYPELAKWLVDQGIESLSLNPDSIISTWLFLANKK